MTRSSKAVTEAHQIISVPRLAFMKSYGRRPFIFSHEAHRLAEFSITSVTELAARLAGPADSARTARLLLSSEPLPPEPPCHPGFGELTARKSREPVRLVLKDIQGDQGFETTISAAFGRLDMLAAQCDRQFRVHRAHVFISSAGFMTPLHTDDDQGFLLQLYGWKDVTFYVLGERYFSSALATRQAGGSEALIVPDQFIKDRITFHIGPGDGVHIPWQWPHMVTVSGTGPSVSLNLNFESARTAANALAAYTNDWLVRFGARPYALGQHVHADLMKRWIGGIASLFLPRSVTPSSGRAHRR
jgi:hypothetical protein